VEDVWDRIAILYNGEIKAEGRVQDLLKKLDRTSLNMPAVEDAKLAELRDFAARLAGGDVEVGNPSMDLETFFVDVVSGAGRADASISGADSGSGIADFLKKGMEPHMR